MPALTGQSKLPVVMLSKQLSSLVDVENYTDEYSLGDTLTSFKYSAGLPGGAQNSFIVDMTVINPTEHFERAILPYFKTLFSKHSENSSLQEGATGDPNALQFYIRWGYGSAEQGMSKIIHGFLTSINYSVTAEGERVITFSFLDQLTFALEKYPEFSNDSNVLSVWEYPDIIKPDGSLTFPSVVVEDLLSQMLASVPNCKGHLVLGSAGLFLDSVWLQLTEQLATGFGTKSIDSTTDGDYPVPLPQDLIRRAQQANVPLTGDCQFITANDNLKINAPGSHYAAQRIAYDMIMLSLGINSGGGEIGETRSDAASKPKPELQNTPTIDGDKPLPSLNDIKLDKSYAVYEVGEGGFPMATDKDLGGWLNAYINEDPVAVNEVFVGNYKTPPNGASDFYADTYGFPGNMPFRPGGLGYNGPDANPDKDCYAGNVLDLTSSGNGMFPLAAQGGGSWDAARTYPSPGYYVALGELEYLTGENPTVGVVTGAGAEAKIYASTYSTISDEASDSAATHAEPPPELDSPTPDKPQTKYRASIVKGEYSTYMDVLNLVIGNINHLLLPMISEEDELLSLVPYFKSTLTTPNIIGIDLWDNIRTTVGLTKSQIKDVNSLLLLASKNVHNQALTNDSGEKPSDIASLSELQSFPSLSKNLPTGPTKNVENGSITSLLLLRVGYDNSIVTDLTFNTDIYAPVIGNAEAQGSIQKLEKIWGKTVNGGVSTNKVLTTFYYVLKESVDSAENELGRRGGGQMSFDKSSPYAGATEAQLEDVIDAGVKSLEALKDSAEKPLELEMTDFLEKMNTYYTKYQRINQEGLLSTADDTSERLDALFSLINSATFQSMFISSNGNENSYVVNGKSIAVKSTPKWKLDLSMMSQIEDSASLSQFLKDKGRWDKGFAEFPFSVTVTTLGIPELSSFVEEDAFRKINLEVSNPRLPEGPKHWTSGVYQILGYSHSIAADSMYTTTFDLLRQPFVEFN